MATNYALYDRSFGRWTGNSSSITCYDTLYETAIVTVPLTDQWQCFTATLRWRRREDLLLRGEHDP